MKIEVFDDDAAVARRAAAVIAGNARHAVTERGKFLMAVSGGKTPWIMLRDLADEEVLWEHVHVFQIDERIAPAGDPDRNLTHLRESLLSHAPLRPEHIHAMPVESADLAASAADYFETLENLAGNPPVRDLARLGMGPDGHTASLIPGDPVLNVRDRDLALTGVYQGRRRMTMTYPLLNRSRLHPLAHHRRKKSASASTSAEGRSLHFPRGGSVAARCCCWQSKLRWGRPPKTPRRWNRQMRIGMATDPGGIGLQEELVNTLKAAGHEVVDFGAHVLSDGDNYPEYLPPLARAVITRQGEHGIAICGSGPGTPVRANKLKGARAALVRDHFSVTHGVEDDHLTFLVRADAPLALGWPGFGGRFSECQIPPGPRRLGKVANAKREPAVSF